MTVLQGAVLGGLPPAPVMLAFALGFVGGGMAPTYYWAERMRGLGRFIASKLPYQPPPGTEEGEAMEAATDTDENTALGGSSDDATDEQGGGTA